MRQISNPIHLYISTFATACRALPFAMAEFHSALAEGHSGMSAFLGSVRVYKERDEEISVTPGGSLTANLSPFLRMEEEINKSMLRGALAEGMNGDPTARRLYCSQRLLSLDLLPPWCKKNVIEICRSAYERADPDEIFRVYFDQSLKGKYNAETIRMALSVSQAKVKLPEFRERAIGYLNLNGIITYDDAKKTLSKISALKLDARPLREVVANTPEINMAEFFVFSPTMEGPIGRAARQAMRSCIEYMFKVRVLEDYLALNHVATLEAPVEKLAGLPVDPWNLGKSRPLQNLIEMQDMFDEELHFVPASKRVEYFSKFIKSSDPVRSLYEIYFPDDLQQKEHEEHRQNVEQRKVEDQRKSFETGVAEAIHHEFGRMPRKDTEQIARRFYALHRRGACSYSEVVEMVTAGNDVQDILDTFYARIKRQSEEIKHAPTQAPATNGSQQEKTPEIQLRYFEQNGRAPFKDWLSTLDDHTKDRIEARLARFEEGNPGDFKALRRGLGGIWEARLAFGPHYRIYIKRLGPGNFLVVSGGTKASQDQDIRQAAKMIEA